MDRQDLTAGSIVSCWFPLSETPHLPGPAARPALVVRVFIDPVDKQQKAIVAYGTSQNTRANAGFEIRVNTAEQIATAGLHRPTRFTLSRMRILPVTREFFAFSTEETCVLGQLDTRLIEILTATCDKLASLTPELRDMFNGATTQPVEDVPSTSLNAATADAYLQKACTGRRDLNGAANGTIVERRPKRRMSPYRRR